MQLGDPLGSFGPPMPDDYRIIVTTIAEKRAKQSRMWIPPGMKVCISLPGEQLSSAAVWAEGEGNLGGVVADSDDKVQPWT